MLMVLWIFIFLFVVAFDFSASVREEATAANRYGDETQGYYLAIGGFEQGLHDFLRQAPSRQSPQDRQRTDLFDCSSREENLGGGVYRVRLVDEAGKININRVNEETLRRVFTNLGIEEPLRSILVDSIMDWRDPDDLHRVNGAENDYYRSLSPPYTAKNGPFDMVEDLLWVKGVTSSLYYGYDDDPLKGGTDTPRVGLREIFTVDSPIDRVNLRNMCPEVCVALLGIPLKKCQDFVEESKKLSEKTLPDLLRLLGIGAGGPAAPFIFTNPSVITVEAEGQPADSRVSRRVKGVVRAVGGQRGFELVRWVDRDVALPRR